jgi:hypothetical protein
LHLLVLTMRGCKVIFELVPSLFNGVLFVPPATCTHEVTRCKYICIPEIDCLLVANEDAPCFEIVGALLIMLEERLSWLLGNPSLAHVLKVDLEIDRGDVPVSLKEVIHHVSR